jgi:hypothetical protein
MTFSGNTVTSWRSKGSSAVSTNVVSGGFTNPTYTSYNSLPALGFNGTSTYIQTGNVSVPGTGMTWITCSVNLTPVTASTPVDSSVVLATEAPSERSIRYAETTSMSYYAINSNLTNNATILRGDVNQNANGIRGFMDTAAHFTGFMNGTQTVSNTTAVNYIATNNQPFLMGKWASGFLNGYIYESLVYNRVLTLAEYRQVEGYLAQKWGFTGSLPAGHPGLGPTLYRWKVPLARLPYYKVYDPRSIPNLTLWFDAADCNTMNISSGFVTSWLSKGSAVVSTSVVTGGGWIPPSYTTYSNRPALAFNGLSTYIQTNPLSLSGTGSTWIASAVNLTPVTGTTPIDASLVIATNNPEKSIRFNCNINATCYSINSNVGNTTTVLRQDTNNNVNGIRGFIDTAGYFTAFGNGTQTVSNTTPVNYLSPVNQRFFMGSWNTGVLNGYIHEILIYNSTLSLAQYRQVEGYLAQKWGYVSALSTSHPAISMPVGAPATGVGKQTISYLPRPLPPSPVTTNLLLNLDATSYTSGSTWPALTGNNYTISGTLTTASSAVIFDGSSYAQDLTGITSSTMYSFTLDVWFYAAANASGSVIGELGQPTLGNWSLTLISINSNTISVGFYSGAQYKLSVGSYTANTWTHVSYTYNNTTKVIIGYVNGIYVTSATVTKLWPTTVYLTTGGAAVPDTNFTGRIGAFKVYNSVLTRAQIRQNYNALAGRYGFGLINYGSVSFTYLPVSPYSGNQYLSASVTAPSTDSVTYECWFYQTTQNSGNNAIFSTRTGGEGNGGIMVGINSYWGGFSLATPTFLANYGFAPSLNTWHHIALVRNGTSAWTFYYDGIAKTSDQGATFTFTSTTSTNIYIGAFASSGYPQQFTGYLTNFRYVKGVAVYTGNFTVPSAPLTVTQSSGTNISAITAGQTQLLLLQADTGGLLTDTANNTTVTNTGSATWDALTPF